MLASTQQVLNTCFVIVVFVVNQINFVTLEHSIEFQCLNFQNDQDGHQRSTVK